MYQPTPHDIVTAIAVLAYFVSDLLGHFGYGGIFTVASKAITSMFSRPDTEKAMEARIAELENMVTNLKAWSEKKDIPPPQAP